MKNVIFIKAYINLNNEEFEKISQDELYDGYRGIWRISKNKAIQLKYAFAIHNNIIKNVYSIESWHDANTTHYTTRKINPNDPKLKGRLEFIGKSNSDMQSFIGQDVSLYYTRGEANPIKYMDLEILQNDLINNIVYPDEIENQVLSEGAKKQITVNAYERNPKARQECIKHYGVKCIICGFDFEEKYKEIGKGFIHVHHVKPLSEVNEKYEVNPIKDLIPVCPNCHAMIHKKKPAYSIEDIQSLLVKNDL